MLAKTKSIFILLGVLSLVILVFPTVASAQTPQPWGGACTDDGSNTGVATIQGLECLIGNVLTVAITAIGVAAFVMFIVASFRYMLSGSNSKGTETARNTLTFAIVGIVVALSAFIIINLISAFTGVGVIRTFKVPQTNVETGL